MITQDKLTPHFEIEDVSSVLSFMKTLKVNYVYNDLGYLAEGEIKLEMRIDDGLGSFDVYVNTAAFPHAPKYVHICTLDKNKYRGKGPFTDIFIEADIIEELNSKPFDYFNMLVINKLRRQLK